MKPCKTCKIELPSVSFHKSTRHLDGRVNTCKKCINKDKNEKRKLKKEDRLVKYNDLKSIKLVNCNYCSETKYLFDFYFENNKNLSTKKCKMCTKKTVNKYRKDNIEHINKKKREYSKKMWKDNLLTDEQKEKRRLQTKNWRYNNKNYAKSYNKKYKKENKELSIEINNRRRARKLQACPKYVCSSDFIQIYKKSKEENMTVDHIIPLSNDRICGLHVPWNLQLLTRSDNSSKNNKFDGTYENDSWRTDG